MTDCERDKLARLYRGLMRITAEINSLLAASEPDLHPEWAADDFAPASKAPKVANAATEGSTA